VRRLRIQKLPGAFRTSQNWIGGNSLLDATFIPPHYTAVNQLMHVKQVAQIIGGSYKTANDLVMEFVKAGILVEMTGQTRNRIFVFQAYVDLF
jgi:hypothetical protein